MDFFPPFLLSSSLLFLSFPWPNCIFLHTKQGPIRPNLHCPIYWCRFWFVGGKAEAFSLIPALWGCGAQEGVRVRGNWRWLGWTTSTTHTFTHIHCIHTFAQPRPRTRTQSCMGWKAKHTHITFEMYSSQSHSYNPQRDWGGAARDEGREGGKDGWRESQCTDRTVTGLNYQASAAHWKQFLRIVVIWID